MILARLCFLIQTQGVLKRYQKVLFLSDSFRILPNSILCLIELQNISSKCQLAGMVNGRNIQELEIFWQDEKVFSNDWKRQFRLFWR